MESHLFQAACQVSPKKTARKTWFGHLPPTPCHILPPGSLPSSLVASVWPLCPALSPWNQSVLTVFSPQSSRDGLQHTQLGENSSGPDVLAPHGTVLT